MIDPVVFILTLLAVLVVACTAAQMAFLAHCLRRRAPAVRTETVLQAPAPAAVEPAVAPAPPGEVVHAPVAVQLDPVVGKPHRHQWQFRSEEVSGGTRRRIHVCPIAGCRDTYIDEEIIKREGGHATV